MSVHRRVESACGACGHRWGLGVNPLVRCDRCGVRYDPAEEARETDRRAPACSECGHVRGPHECAAAVGFDFEVGDLVRDAERYVGTVLSVQTRANGAVRVFMTVRVEDGADIPRLARPPIMRLAGREKGDQTPGDGHRTRG